MRSVKELRGNEKMQQGKQGNGVVVHGTHSREKKNNVVERSLNGCLDAPHK